MSERLVVVGAMNMDLAVATQELPKKGESVLGSSILQSPGGKGANQAVAAALVGGTVSLISMRGDDQYGRELIDSAIASGVDVSLVQVSDEELTGTAVIAVDSHGDNMIVISPGANSLITPEIASANLKNAKDVSVVSICGELPLPTIKAALETAGPLGAISVLNLSPYNPAALEFLGLAKVLVVNQHEAADITGIPNPLQDWPATIAGFAALGCSTVVVTLGADGAMILDCLDPSSAPIKVDSIKVNAVDTTGCGDAFTGAMCVELANGKDISTAVKFAVQVAAYAATSAGAQRSYGTREQIGISA
jgi:ribokinase